MSDTIIHSDITNSPLFVTAPRHLEQLLSEELSAILPEATIRVSGSGAGVIPPAGRTAAYAQRVELWSRLAGRVLIQVARGRTADRDAVYSLARQVPWELHTDETTTFAIGGHTSHRAFRNPNLPRLVLKDALCDRFVERTGTRPSVDTDAPKLRLYAFVTDRETILYVDASLGSLHRRGYRTDAVAAPLRENTAAGVLARSGWTAAVERWRATAPYAGALNADTAPADSAAFEIGQAAGSPSTPAGGRSLPPLFVDPMCGSGTIAIEAAMIACDIAPGFLRKRSGLAAWGGFDAKAWKRLREEVGNRAEQGRARWLEAGGLIWASDIDRKAIEAAKSNASRAGAGDAITFNVADFAQLSRKDIQGDPDREFYSSKSDASGESPVRERFLVTNPPYGVRIRAGGESATRAGSSSEGGDDRHVGSGAGGENMGQGASSHDTSADERQIYSKLGRWLSRTVPGFHATILAQTLEQSRALGLQAKKLHRFYNGAMEIVAARIELGPGNRYQPPRSAGGAAPSGRGEVALPSGAEALPVSRENVEMVANRLRKNRRLLKKYLAREKVSCFRLYDADIPQHAAAVDVYGTIDGERSVVLQEYAAPKEIEAETAATRLAELIEAVADVLEVPRGSIAGDEAATETTRLFVKKRRRQRGKHQYKRNEHATSVVRTVYERELAFEVNFTDYLDTGLFCDQRITRQRIRDRAEGKSVLNLFAYTCSASVAAAAGGAATTTSVDTSKHYLDWGKRNFQLNGLSDNRHHFVCEDAFAYLERGKSRFDLVYIDPPVYSNSKDRQTDFDVQRDHAQLLGAARERLHDGGAVIFANNLRGFELDDRLGEHFDIFDWSAETLPPDFVRQAKRHHVFLLRPRQGV